MEIKQYMMLSITKYIKLDNFIETLYPCLKELDINSKLDQERDL